MAARRVSPHVMAVGLLLAGALSGPAAMAQTPPPPPRAAAVHVAAGKLTSGITVAMPRTAFGSVSGRVLERGSHRPLANLQVVAYSPSHQLVRRAYTDPAGRYLLNVPASVRGYAICFRASPRGVPKVRGGTSTTGWAPQCYRNSVWAGVAHLVPPDAPLVRVPKGHVRTHVDALMRPGGAISGTIARRGDGRPVRSTVYIRSVGAPHYRGLVGTDGFGRYRAVGLPPAPGGYQICFDTRTGGNGPGTVPQCFGTTVWRVPKLDFEGNAAWPDVHWPAAATHVLVRLGAVRKGIGARVRRAGAIAGRLVDRSTGARLDEAAVHVYDSRGRLVGSTSAFEGRFQVPNLPPASADHVCVFPQRYVAQFLQSGRPDSYQRGCYRATAWTGRAGRTAGRAVRVAAGKIRTHVVVALRRASTVRGRVTSARTGAPAHGRVYLFTAGGQFLASQSTDDFGRPGEYAFMGLPASSSGYLVCATAIRRKHLTKPWLRPACYGPARWDGTDRAPAADAEAIPVGADVHRRGLDIALHTGGAMSGSVAKADTGQPLRNVRLFVIDDRGRRVVQTEVRPDGTWSVEGLDPARTYRICFANFPRSWNYQPTCYPQVRWYRPWTE